MVRKLPQYFEQSSETVADRVAVGLNKLGLAMKHEAWAQANEQGLSPTQGQIVAALVAGALSASELSAKLGLSLPTISDSVRALVEKGYVDKERDPRHPRASLLSLSARGRNLSKRVRQWPDFLATAVNDLSEDEQRVMLTAVVKMIRSLQESGHIPVQRMCVSCRYFQPRVRAGETPHHCAFVDAPMADRHLRVDCAEHALAAPTEQADAWRRFVAG
jgi:DNA-binding MarR family transcriptional regulator